MYQQHIYEQPYFAADLWTRQAEVVSLEVDVYVAISRHIKPSMKPTASPSTATTMYSITSAVATSGWGGIIHTYTICYTLMCLHLH